jgi:hypothetical protein
MTRGLGNRLSRIERLRAAGDPPAAPRATVLRLAPDEASAPHLVALIERSEHRRGWPVLAIRADWPAVAQAGSLTA